MSRTRGTPTPTAGTGPSTSQDPSTPNSPSPAGQQTSPDTSVATPQPMSGTAPSSPPSSPASEPGPETTQASQEPNSQPYTSTAAITIVHPDFVDDDTAATIKLKPQVRFFFKERPEAKKATVTDPEDPLFRPIVPETITLKFNIGPHNNLSNLKTIIYQAIRPVLGGRARLSAQSTWIVDPPSLVDLSHYVAIQDPTGKRLLWFWGTEIPPNHPKTHVAITGKWVAALKDKEIEALPTIICRYGYDLTEQANYNAFYVAVLASQKKSRGGFPDSVVHNDIVARLREMWGTRYDALTADWQRWATELVRTPAHQLDGKMREGPPAALVRCFKPIQAQAERQLQVVHDQSRISHSFLRQISPMVDHLAGVVKDLANTLDAVQRDVKALQSLLATQMDLANAYRISTQPAGIRRTRSAAADIGLPDTSDSDHRFTDSDDSGSDNEGGQGQEQAQEQAREE